MSLAGSHDGRNVCIAPSATLTKATAALQGFSVSFEALLAMRQAHGFAFGKSDMFLLCGMQLDAASAEQHDGRPPIKHDSVVRSLQPFLCGHTHALSPHVSCCILAPTTCSMQVFKIKETQNSAV